MKKPPASAALVVEGAPIEITREDCLLVCKYLEGVLTDDKRGLPRRSFMKHDSPDARQARKVLARMFAEHRRLVIRRNRDWTPASSAEKALCSAYEALRDLFEPDPQASWSGRELVARHRPKRGRRRHPEADVTVGYFLEESRRNGATVNAAVMAAVKKFNLTRKRVYDLLRAHRAMYSGGQSPV